MVDHVYYFHYTQCLSFLVSLQKVKFGLCSEASRKISRQKYRLRNGCTTIEGQQRSIMYNFIAANITDIS